MEDEKMLKEIESLQMKIDQFKSDCRYESSELADLFASLAKAQMDMEIAKTDSNNPFFKSKYADLTSVVKASRPFLSRNGLAVIQRVLTHGNGMSYLYTRLCHSSGQWIESKMAIQPAKNDIQTIGSCITYLRRYCYAAIVGVVVSEEDDDAEQVMQHARKTSFVAPVVNSSKISREQLEILSKELEGHTQILDIILKGFSLSKLSDLESKYFQKCLERVKQIKSNNAQGAV